MPKSICSIDGCESTSIARGMCSMHYQRARSFGDPHISRRPKPVRQCSVGGCASKHFAKSYCAKHYERFHRYGDALQDRRRIRKPCSVDGCDRLSIARGLCQPHWSRSQQGRPLGGPVRERILTEDLGARLRHYVAPETPNGCWEWTGARNKNYGMVSIPGSKLRGAHIVAWEVAHGTSLPEGMVIRHTCDNPPCVNPDHLLLGTPADNIHDAVTRDRNAYGSRHGIAKLTEELVREIRSLHEAGVSQREIGNRFGVTQANVNLVVTRKTWRHVA